ncbi:MAG: (Fe-S)-binding protein [Candidatus Methanomethylicaceae archaeon]
MVQDYRKLAEMCTLCGACAEVCPFFRATGNIKYGAMAKVESSQRLLRGEPLDEEDLKTIFLCTRCDQCHRSCPMNIPISIIVQGARSELRRLKKVPEKYNTIAEAIIKSGSPMAAPPEKRLAYIPEGFKPPSKAEYLYVPGCWSGIRLPETAKASVELLRLSGLDFTVLGDREWCCGLFLIDTGLLDEAKKLAEKNTALFESTGAETVITECPSCHDVFKNVYPELFREPKYQVVHISEVLRDLLKEGRLRVKKSGRRIAYKDPCPLIRRNTIGEAPREVISKVAELVEYDENGWDALCCGAPAGVKPIFPEIANKLAEVLIEEPAKKGADIGVGCAFCMYHMSGVLKPTSPRIETLSQIVLQNLIR